MSKPTTGIVYVDTDKMYCNLNSISILPQLDYILLDFLLLEVLSYSCVSNIIRWIHLVI